MLDDNFYSFQQFGGLFSLEILAMQSEMNYCFSKTVVLAGFDLQLQKAGLSFETSGRCTKGSVRGSGRRAAITFCFPVISAEVTSTSSNLWQVSAVDQLRPLLAVEGTRARKLAQPHPQENTHLLQLSSGCLYINHWFTVSCTQTLFAGSTYSLLGSEFA